MSSEEKNQTKGNIRKVIELVKQHKKQTKIVAYVVVGAFVLFCVAYTLGLFKNEEGMVTTITKSSLEKVIEISDLATVEYPYNSVATVYDEDNKDKYSIAYDGTIRAGIDFNNVKMQVEPEDKRVIVTLPEVEIQDKKIDIKEFIFTKDKYETETILEEAHNACLKDLESKIKDDNAFFDMAKENAVETIKALLEPWIEQIDEEYKVEIK